MTRLTTLCLAGALIFFSGCVDDSGGFDDGSDSSKSDTPALNSAIEKSQRTCDAVGSALGESELPLVFDEHHETYKEKCLENPAAENLWPKDERHDARVYAYCQMSIVFRACFVCNLKTAPEGAILAADHSDSAAACQGQFSLSDRGVFADNDPTRVTDENLAKALWPAVF